MNKTSEQQPEGSSRSEAHELQSMMGRASIGADNYGQTSSTRNHRAAQIVNRQPGVRVFRDPYGRKHHLSASSTTPYYIDPEDGKPRLLQVQVGTRPDTRFTGVESTWQLTNAIAAVNDSNTQPPDADKDAGNSKNKALAKVADGDISRSQILNTVVGGNNSNAVSSNTVNVAGSSNGQTSETVVGGNNLNGQPPNTMAAGDTSISPRRNQAEKQGILDGLGELGMIIWLAYSSFFARLFNMDITIHGQAAKNDDMPWTWEQVELKDKTAPLIRLIYWIFKSVPGELIASTSENDEELVVHCGQAPMQTQAEISWKNLPAKVWLSLLWRYILGTIALLLLLILPGNVEGQIRNHGFFDPVRYRDWDYAKVARNEQELETPGGKSASESLAASSRLAEPQNSCMENEEKGLGQASEERPQNLAGYFSAQQAVAGSPSGVEESRDARESKSEWDSKLESWKRRLLPTHLCFREERDPVPKLENPYSNLGYVKRSLDEVDRELGYSFSPTYVFVSYSRAQFYVHTEEEIQSIMKEALDKGKPISESGEQKFRMQIPIDRKYLTDIALQAAREADVDAFWIDFECVDPYREVGSPSKSAVSENQEPDKDDRRNGIMPDVYRICDATRAAHAMIIVLGPQNPVENDELGTYPQMPLYLSAQIATDEDKKIKQSWLHQWGERLWTLPELLLAPKGKPITIYYLGMNENKRDRLQSLTEDWEIETLFKHGFPSRAYKKEDAEDIAALVDHYEGSLVLSRLGLVTYAVQALWRQQTRTILDGDYSYALMGLLRSRPKVVSGDGDFQAFARLSLANDSDRLLERLICLLPKHRSDPWHNWTDDWPGVKLWDIEPHTQVAAIIDNRTVILDGAWGATIHWGRLHTVGFIKRSTFWRDCMKLVIRFAPLLLIVSIPMIAAAPKPGKIVVNTPNGPVTVGSGSVSGSLVAGIIILIIAYAILLVSPTELLRLYRGKFWSVQGWFFGIEGYADLGTVEQYLFGHDHKRLKWSTNGSMLSQHEKSRNGHECFPLPPAPSRWTRAQFYQERQNRFKKKFQGRQKEYVATQDRNAQRTANNQQNQPQGPTERVFTLINTYSMEATMFWAEIPPTAVLICGREGGMQRALLCSFDWKTNSFVRETVVRMKTPVLERMFRVDRFRFSLSRLRPHTKTGTREGSSSPKAIQSSDPS